MKQDLNNKLQSVKVPERSAGYWEAFPGRVVARLNDPAPVSAGHWRWALATACVLVVAAAMGWRFWPRAAAPGMDYAKLAREIAKEFPGQLKAIMVDERGMRVELAEAPGVPVSSPVLVEVCRPQGCRRVITFSGQQININGEPWDVLVNGDGRVIVAGRSTGKYQVAARQLEAL
jgi:hypothetical protein